MELLFHWVKITELNKRLKSPEFWDGVAQEGLGVKIMNHKTGLYQGTPKNEPGYKPVGLLIFLLWSLSAGQRQ